MFLSSNQVTRLVNRMEVLSEELHPSLQSNWKPASVGLSPLSPTPRLHKFCFSSTLPLITPKHYYCLEELQLRYSVYDFVCLPFFVSGLLMFLGTHRCVERYYFNCGQDIRLTVCDLISCLLRVPEKRQRGMTEFLNHEKRRLLLS